MKPHSLFYGNALTIVNWCLRLIPLVKREKKGEREKNGRKVRQYHGLSKWVSLLHFNSKAKRQHGAKTIQNNSGSMESMDFVYFTRLRWIPIFWDNKLELAESMSSTKLLLLYFDDFCHWLWLFCTIIYYKYECVCICVSSHLLMRSQLKKVMNVQCWIWHWTIIVSVIV